MSDNTNPSIIKVRYIKDGKPVGMPYPYYTHDTFMIGDIVEANLYAKAMVVDIDVPKDDESVKGRELKYIYGRV